MDLVVAGSGGMSNESERPRFIRTGIIKERERQEGESSNPMEERQTEERPMEGWIMDWRNLSPWPSFPRMPDQLALFGLEFKILKEQHPPRRLFCTVTVDDGYGSEDIYNDWLPTTALAGGSSSCIYLPLTGPKNLIAAEDQVYFAVALLDPDDPKSVVPEVHVCDKNCPRFYISCGTYPAGSCKGSSAGLFVWAWGESTMWNSFHKVCSVDLLDYAKAVHVNNSLIRDMTAFCVPCGRREAVAHSYGCSLNLKYAAFRFAVVAKVKVVVVVVKGARHNICTCGRGLVITADCDVIYEGIVLFRKDYCSCYCSGSNVNNIETTSEEEIQLDRCFVTLPSPPSVLKVEAATLGNAIIGDSASFSAQISGTSEKSISGWYGDILLRVTVTWT